MTSVPKPLKFMKPHFATMKEIYNKLEDDYACIECADVISVLAMTMGEGRDCLKYRLCSDLTRIGEWGHEYVRHLSGEIAAEWGYLTGEGENETDLKDKLIQLVKQIIPYNMAHNAEAEACDLLMEIEHLDLLEHYVDDNMYHRVCLYLTRLVIFVFKVCFPYKNCFNIFYEQTILNKIKTTWSLSCNYLVLYRSFHRFQSFELDRIVYSL